MDGGNIPGPTSQTLALPILPPCHGRRRRRQHSQDETAQILVEFLEVAITSIVFLKGIYPAGAVERRKNMNLVVHIARHLQLRDYIHSVVSGLLPFIKKIYPRSLIQSSGKAYIDWAAQMVVGLNTSFPWVLCKQDDAPDPVILTLDMASIVTTSLQTRLINQRCGLKPRLDGLLRYIGGAVPYRPAEGLAFSVTKFIQKGGSFINYYMVSTMEEQILGKLLAGGLFIAASYDYDAPMDEYGMLGQPKWGHLKRERHSMLEGDGTNGKLPLKPIIYILPRGKWLSSCLDTLKINMEFLQRCIFPRCTFSMPDAVYCAMFVHTLHSLGTPFFNTVNHMDVLICRTLQPMICCCTESEVGRLGKFLCETLKIGYYWKSDESIYERECGNMLGFVVYYRFPDSQGVRYGQLICQVNMMLTQQQRQLSLASKLGVDSGLRFHVGDESRANAAQDNELFHQNPQAYAAQDGNWIARIAALLVGEDRTQSCIAYEIGRLSSMKCLNAYKIVYSESIGVCFDVSKLLLALISKLLFIGNNL
ncbi:hypothetical protein ABKV19_000291 [Rosa sericea]